MTTEDITANTTDAGPIDREPKGHKTRGGPMPPHVGAKSHKRAHDDEYSQVKEKGQAQAERLELAEHNKGNIDNLPATTDADNAKLPASYKRAKQALAECESIDECKAWADKAAALAACGRMQEDTELEKYALRIRAHAARRAGELLHEIRGETGGRPPRKEKSGAHSPEFTCGRSIYLHSTAEIFVRSRS